MEESEVTSKEDGWWEDGGRMVGGGVKLVSKEIIVNIYLGIYEILLKLFRL